MNSLLMDPVTINAFSNSYMMDPVSITAGCTFSAILTGLVIIILGTIITGLFSLIRTAGDCSALKSDDFSRHQVVMPKPQLETPKLKVVWEEPTEWWNAPEDISHGVPMSMKRKFHTTF